MSRADAQGGESWSLSQAVGRSSEWGSRRKDGPELRAHSGGP